MGYKKASFYILNGVKYTCFLHLKWYKIDSFFISNISDPTDTTHKYPTSSHKTRNWDKLEQEVKEEEKTEKLEGDAALNKLFQQIYSDGTDETKKAMMKSFVSASISTY